MNIYLEGSDATGKTTLANILSNELEMLIVKGSSFELATSTNEELYSHFKKVANLNNAIVDRSIWSNKIYATLYNDYTILTNEQRNNIEEKMKQNGDIIIYLTAPEEVIIDRLNERGDDYVSPDMIKPILEEYKSTMSEAVQNNLNVFFFDTNQHSSEDIAEIIISKIEKIHNKKE